MLEAGRVMIGLSVRPSFAVLAGHLLLAASAHAQLPVWQPPADSTPDAELAPSPSTQPPSPDAVPTTETEAAAPAPAPTPEPSLPESRKAPAKTEIITLPGPARHEDSEALEGESSLHPRRRWYGWQTLVSDGAATLCFITAGTLGSADHERASQALAWLGLLGYEFAPGIVHFAHGHPGRGFASMGVRFGMPLAGAFVGASAASGCNGYECEAGGAALGLLAGMGGAIAMDAAVFAYDAAGSGTPAAPVAGLTPLVLVTPGRTWFGLWGRL